jgi:hypothetical protein
MAYRDDGAASGEGGGSPGRAGAARCNDRRNSV